LRGPQFITNIVQGIGQGIKGIAYLGRERGHEGTVGIGHEESFLWWQRELRYTIGRKHLGKESH
jgi:hypothetical protein